MTSSIVDAEAPSHFARRIVAARDGSAEALGSLMKFSREYLLVIANSELPVDLHAKGGASDLVQETQLDAIRGFALFRGYTAAKLLGWLREILMHNIRCQKGGQSRSVLGRRSDCSEGPMVGGKVLVAE